MANKLHHISLRGLLFLGHPVYAANFNKSINRDLNDTNKTQQPFIFHFISLHNSIDEEDFDRSTALGIGAL